VEGLVMSLWQIGHWRLEWRVSREEHIDPVAFRGLMKLKGDDMLIAGLFNLRIVAYSS